VQILQKRGLHSPEEQAGFLNPDYEAGLADPFLLSGMDKAVGRLLKAREKKEQVCIFGDFDADGVTASALLKDLFRQLKIDCFCYIPDKTKEGYGINQAAIDYVLSQGAQVLVSVDCGISNAAEVEYAQKQGLEVIITDHHHPPPDLPEAAVALVNPRLPEDQYPFKDLAGVGVAFKLAQALAQKAGLDAGQLKWLLDLVAIGTIADCVPLVGENRVLTKFGLMVLAKTRRVGLRQLFQVGRIPISESEIPSAWQVSFQIAPRVNAAGRMDHANIALNLITSKENQEAQARTLALELEEKNQRRQKVTEAITQDLDERLNKQQSLPPLILESADWWDFGVIGLAAGRVAEKYRRPVILLKEDEDRFRGSARSIPGFNIIEALEQQRGLLGRYGGHAQAAGLELEKKNLNPLQEGLLQAAGKLTAEDFAKKIVLDLALDFSEVGSELLKKLKGLEPFGQGNAMPVFLSRNLTVLEKRALGNGEKHLKLQLGFLGENGRVPRGPRLEAVWFNYPKEELEELQAGSRIDLLYHLEENRWNGKVRIQAKVVDLEVIA
jgi:single-stranded-DNA-specific exonuclease